MRFLTGMLFGTALTLLAATAVDAPTHALLDRTSSQAESVRDKILQLTSTALFKQPDTSTPAVLPPGPDKVANTLSLQSTEPPAPRVDTVAESKPETVGSMADLTGEEQAMALASAPFDLPLVSSRTATRTSTPIREQEPLEIQGAASTTASIIASPTADTTSVWVPFHSERSALGFARRLTNEVAHPFAVERKGPGAYQVVYEAASADEIAGLEARIAEVTGR